MVTGPMPRNPNATRPNANTAGATISAPKPKPLIQAPMAINAIIARPSQNALKLPATRPDRILSDAPPSSDEVTTSRTCRELMEVKTFTSSGMIAPASVPQVMTDESFHHNVVVAAQIRNDLAGHQIGGGDGNHRRQPHQRGQRRFEVHLGDVAVAALGNSFVDEVGNAEEITIITRITKIHTSSCT